MKRSMKSVIAMILTICCTMSLIACGAKEAPIGGSDGPTSMMLRLKMMGMKRQKEAAEKTLRLIPQPMLKPAKLRKKTLCMFPNLM